MPAFTFHAAVAKELNKDLLLNEEEFLLGSIAPDCWRNRNDMREKNRYLSHFQSEELGFEKENYDFFYSKYYDKISEPFYMGYLVHLMTDDFYRRYVEGKYIKYIDGAKYYKLLDGTLFTGGDKDLSDKYWINVHAMDLPIKDYYDLHLFRKVEEVFKSLPEMEEIDMDALNATIEYANRKLEEAVKTDSDMFDFEIAKKHITECTEFIKKELERLSKSIKIR